MSERPTPVEIASTYKGGVKALRRLESYGYRIVHPDDVPDGHEWFGVDYDLPEALGWNDCRAHIFGEGS